MNLTDEQLNIEICKWRGWKFESRTSHITDLNAMHEAEKGLTVSQAESFGMFLEEQLNENCGHECAAQCYDWHATSRQRAIALLRVVKPELFNAKESE